MSVPTVTHLRSRPSCMLLNSAYSSLNINHLPAWIFMCIRDARALSFGLPDSCMRLGLQMQPKTYPAPGSRAASTAYPALRSTTPLAAASEADLIIFRAPAPEDFDQDHFPFQRGVGWLKESGYDILIPSHERPALDGTRIIAVTGFNGMIYSSQPQPPSTLPCSGSHVAARPGVLRPIAGISQMLLVCCVASLGLDSVMRRGLPGHCCQWLFRTAFTAGGDFSCPLMICQ